MFLCDIIPVFLLTQPGGMPAPGSANFSTANSGQTTQTTPASTSSASATSASATATSHPSTSRPSGTVPQPPPLRIPLRRPNAPGRGGVRYMTFRGQTPPRTRAATIVIGHRPQGGGARPTATQPGTGQTPGNLPQGQVSVRA